MSFIRARFFKGKKPRPKYITSSVWRGISDQMLHILKEGRWTLGRQTSVNFWLDNWLGYSLADRLGIPHFVRDFLDFTVADYFFDGAWHLGELFVMKHKDIVQDILNHSCEADDDTLVWPLEMHGDISAKGAYRAAQNHFPEVSWGKWIWGAFIPTKRSTLLWRVIYGKLPTWDFLRRRGFEGPSRCALCGRNEEDLDHLWCHCPWARVIFDKVSSVFNVHLIYDFGIHHCLLQAMAKTFSPQILSIWRFAVVTMIWLIWDQRNRYIFDGETARTSCTIAQFWAFMREANGTRLGHMHNKVLDLSILFTFGIEGWPSKAPSIVGIRWQPPPIHYLKVNVDGGADGAPGRITGGGVFRDRFGVFRGCFAIQHGTGFAFEAELATAFTTIALAHDKHWMNIWLESDSSYVVNFLKTRPLLVPWRLLGQWHKTRRLMDNMQIVVSHIFREGNASADRLTREPVDRFVWWCQAPEFLVPYLNRYRNVEFFRFSS
ncbi:hypothetical protein ACS0TY_003595 [Phlomoides rotata]